MGFGIAIVIASVLGIIQGIRKKRRILLILSIFLLVFTIAVWVYFYFNPY